MKGLTGHFRDQSKIRALRCSVHTEPDLTRKKILFRFNRFFFFSRSKIRPVPCEHSSNLLKFHGYTQEPITWYTLIFNPHGLFYIIDCRRKMKKFTGIVIIMALVLMQNVDQTEGFGEFSDRIMINKYMTCIREKWRSKGSTSVHRTPSPILCNEKFTHTSRFCQLRRGKTNNCSIAGVERFDSQPK